MKTCSKCHEHLELVQFYKSKRTKDGYLSWCRNCNNKYRKINYSFYKRRNEKLKANYGLGLEEFNQILLDQDNRCAICKSNTPGGKGTFNVDHNHTTGQVRGLLCHWCNFMIGQSRESIEILSAGIDYLKKWSSP